MNIKRIPQIYFIVVLFLMCIPAMLPLFHPGFFTIHDDEQVGRLYELDVDVHAGHLPPRLAPDLGYGYDYPLFNFYPSFVYYIAEIFHLIGFSFITSIKLMIALGFLLAAWFMYLFVKKYFGPAGGLIGAVAYTYAPYHSVDVYVRGALPEFWSFVFIPLLLFVFALLSEQLSLKVSICVGIILAGFLLTHNLILLMSFPFLIIFLGYLVTKTKNKRMFLLLTCISCITGAGLTSYFWLPELLEKQYTLVNLLTVELANYNLHFVYIPQFWNTFWGYGGSVLGPMDGLSFQLGRMHLFYLLLAFIMTIGYFVTKRKGIGIILLLWILFLLSLFMQTFYSRAIWNILGSTFAYIQFPWRYLTYSAFCTSALIASLIYLTKNRMIKLGIIIVVSLTIVVWTISYFQPQTYLTNHTDQSYIAPSVIRWNTSNLSFEYVPKGIQTKISSIGRTTIAIDKNQIAKSPFAIIEGTPLIKTIQNLPQKKVFSISSDRSSTVQINVYSFPGWKVYMDNNQVQYSDANRLKLLRIIVPRGNHTIIALFVDTTVRSVGNSISLITCCLIIAVFFMQKRIINFFDTVMNNVKKNRDTEMLG